MKPLNIAFDPIRKKTYVSAVHDKAKVVVELDPDTMAVTPVRTITAPPDNVFWVRDGIAVFWSIGKTIVIPLDDPNVKAKTLKMPTEKDTFDLHVAYAPEPTELLAVLRESVHRFDGDRWTPVDSISKISNTIVRATLRGAFVRTNDVWKPLVEGTAVRATVSVSRDRALVAGFDGSVVIGLDGSSPKPIPNSNWCSVGHAGGFFAWQDYKVLAIDFDGNVRDTEITNNEEAADRCLFRAGDCVFFVKRSTIHRYRDGTWTEHDMKAV